MPDKKVVILDGSGSGDKDLSPVLNVLSHVLQEDGAPVETFPLREMKLAHCLGCFGCWVKTPGMCVEADAGREIAKAIIRSDVTVLFTPVTFGGYSPELKKMVDRFVQLASPFFQMDHGEVHHPPRYAHRPRLMMVGVQRHANPHEAHIFKTLAGRNAINLHPPSYAAEVVLATDDADALRARFESLLTRSDALPFGDAAASLMPAPVMPGAAVEPVGARRALLIVGSPKTKEPSTSGVLGGYLLDRLKERGWETESLTLRASLNRPEGEGELLSSVERAGLILLVFPLYVDALPYLVTKALAVIAAHRRADSQAVPAAPGGDCEQRLSRDAPEFGGVGHLPRVRRPKRLHVGWRSCLGRRRGDRRPASHGGETLGSARQACDRGPGDDRRGPGRGTAGAGRGGEDDREEPIPFALWRWLYIWMGGKGFEKLAAKNGISKDNLLARPYAA